MAAVFPVCSGSLGGPSPLPLTFALLASRLRSPLSRRLNSANRSFLQPDPPIQPTSRLHCRYCSLTFPSLVFFSVAAHCFTTHHLTNHHQPAKITHTRYSVALHNQQL